MGERSIFQTLWKIHSCTKFLSFELETSNFGSSYVFSSPLKWRGRIWPNLTFWIQNWHISGKIQVTFWRLRCCAKSLFFELETSNFGSSYVFSSPLKWAGRILPNCTFLRKKRHISGKIRYHYAKIFVSWVRDFKFWLQPCFFKPVKMAGSDFT